MPVPASLNTGLQFARNKQYQDAIQEFTTLVLHDQTYADAFFYRGCAYLQVGEYKKAIEDFNSAMSSSKFSTKHELAAFYKRGYAYYKTNQFDPALEDYRYYLDQCKSSNELNHLLHKGYFQMGIIYSMLNQNNQAIIHFNNAIDLSQNTDEEKQKLYYLHRGRAYACLAKYDEAKEDLQLVIEQSNDLFVKGCAYNELGQHENAQNEFNTLLQSNENNSQLVQTSYDHILFRLGLSCASLNLHEQALNHFQTALDHSKQQNSMSIIDRILFRKGMSNVALDHTHRALIDLKKSTEYNQYQSDVFYARGMLHNKLGRHDAAVYDQRKAMELERKLPSLTFVQNTINYTDKQGDIHNNYMYYENKIREKEELLKKHEGTPNEPIIHRKIADDLQKQASFSINPSTTCGKARGHIKAASEFPAESFVANRIAFAFNGYYNAYLLTEMHNKGTVPESVVEDYIKYTTDNLLYMRNLFDQCVTKRDLNELILNLRSELNKSNIQQVSNYDIIHNSYINNQLEKCEIMQKRMTLFADSPAQQEFYRQLVTRIWNLFDGIRIASTGIFSHTLEGTYTKLSKVFKLFGFVFSYVPITGQYTASSLGICESGLKKLDELRIQNALEQLGCILNPTSANETADAIVTELTIMYENQIKRFPTTTEEINLNHQKQQTNVCTECSQQVCRCSKRTKNRILNQIEHSTIRTIVEYGVTLFINCLVELKSDGIENTKTIHNIFVNGVCRSSDIIIFPSKLLANKIKPKDAEKNTDYWNTFDFYRRPAINFRNGTIRAQKEGDHEKFGSRKSTLEEEYFLQRKPDELSKCGFK